MSSRANYRLNTVAAALLCVVAYLLLQSLVTEVKAFMLATTVGVIYIIASERWQLRRKFWFWGVLGLIAFVHLMIIFSLGSIHFAGPSLLVWPMMFLDCWIGLLIMDRISGRHPDKHAG